MFLVEAKRTVIVIVGAILNALSLNFFLISANVYANGFTGVAQLTASVFNDFLGIGLSTGIILFFMNVPVVILGWLKVGKTFTIYSVISVLITTALLEILPVVALSEDIILNAVFGGVFAGIGVGITLKHGTSTGGMDIVALVISRIKDKSIGVYLLILNTVIIILAGILYEPENALYTLVTVYVTTRVIDAIHTRHEKVTAMIITHKDDELQRAIHDTLVRGITILPVRGAYSGDDKSMLYLVVTRYELYDLKRIIGEVDPDAFTNIVQTNDILGFFRRDE